VLTLYPQHSEKFQNALVITRRLDIKNFAILTLERLLCPWADQFTDYIASLEIEELVENYRSLRPLLELIDKSYLQKMLDTLQEYIQESNINNEDVILMLLPLFDNNISIEKPVINAAVLGRLVSLDDGHIHSYKQSLTRYFKMLSDSQRKMLLLDTKFSEEIDVNYHLLSFIINEQKPNQLNESQCQEIFIELYKGCYDGRPYFNDFLCEIIANHLDVFIDVTKLLLLSLRAYSIADLIYALREIEFIEHLDADELQQFVDGVVYVMLQAGNVYYANRFFSMLSSRQVAVNDCEQIVSICIEQYQGDVEAISLLIHLLGDMNDEQREQVIAVISDDELPESLTDKQIALLMRYAPQVN
jgi:hypothetical protein